MKPTLTSVCAFAPATVANVACGYDVLGFCLEEPGDEVTASISKTDGIKIIKIDIDQHPELSKSLLILSVPTLILFVEQKEVWRIKGFEAASVLIKTIDKYVAA